MWPADLLDLETLLRTRLGSPLPGADAQRRFAPQPTLKAWDPAARPPQARQAAALLLIYPGAHGPSVVLTERHADLPHHGGQVSLPGGGVHEGEEYPEAALREAQEEIGIDPASARVLGSLSPLWVIVSNFILHPIVAVAASRPAFVAAPREVETVIEVPLMALGDSRRHRWDRRRRQADRTSLDIAVPYFAVDADAGGRQYQVWGATAMVLGEFCALLDPAFGPGPPPRWTPDDAITLF